MPKAIAVDSYSRYDMRIFTSNHLINSDYHVIGNPAQVIIDFKDRVSRAYVAKNSYTFLDDHLIKYPITVFIDICNFGIKKISYYFPDGRQVPFCGHGTIAAAYAIRQNLKLRSNVYFFKLSLPIDKKHSLIEVEFLSENIYKLKLKNIKLYKTQNAKLKNFIFDKKIFSNLYETDLQDILFFHNDYSLNFKKEELDHLRSIIPSYRSIMAVSPSRFNNCDFEVKVWSDSLPGPYYQDLACGSANMQIPPLLKIEGKLKDFFSSSNKAILKFAYPYAFDANQKLGGLQYVKYDDFLKETSVIGSVD